MTNIKATKRAILSSVLATILCFAMLAGTTFAWFTDTVTSSGNIIQTGSLEVGMYWAKGSDDPAADDTTWTDASKGPMYTADTLWEPGYADAKHIKIVNEGNLALNYKLRIVANGIVGKLADVIDVYYFDTAKKLEKADIEAAEPIGTLAEILGTQFNISKKVNGMLVPKSEADAAKELYSEKTISLVLVMNTEADEEYENTSLGCEFSVELIATQASYEEDSFNNEYDLNVPDPAIPAALVRPLEDLNIQTTIGVGGAVENMVLNTGYKFQPTMGRPEEDGYGLLDDEQMKDHLEYDPNYNVENSEYRWWHADFVVSVDRDVPSESMALAGYYSAWCDSLNDGNWVALTHGDVVKANDEFRLVSTLCYMTGWDISVSWNDLCLYGNDSKGFMCGAVDRTGVNAGTTLTVELYLYETGCDDPGCHHPTEACEVEGGESIKVGEFKYTFGLKAWDGTYDEKQLPKADENGVVTIETAAQLAAFANDVNNGGNTYSGKTVVLANDIDLGNKAWTPIGQTGATEFKGTFDGQGHTIYNLKVDSSAQTGANYSSGLFGWIESSNNITIKNVKIDGATVVGHHNVAVIAGYVEGNAVIDNCTVTNATITNIHANGNACGDKTGLIAGYVAGEVTIKNCTVSDSTVSGSRDAGQLIGASYAVPVNCSATNVTVSATTGCDHSNAGGNIANDLVGRKLGSKWN